MTVHTYAHKPRPVAREAVYELRPGMLVARHGAREVAAPYREVRSVRLAYAPASIARHGFEAQVRLADGRVLVITNLDWAGLADLRRRDVPYAAFVRELLAKVAAGNPRALFLGGHEPWRWGALAAVTLALAGAIAVLLARALAGGRLGEAGVLGAIGLASAWQLGPLLTRNRPRRIDPTAPPPELLP